MKKDNNISFDLLQDYVEGKLSFQYESIIEEHLSKNTEDMLVVNGLREFYANETEPEAKLERLFDKVDFHVKALCLAFDWQNHQKSSKITGWILGVAAAISLLFASGVFNDNLRKEQYNFPIIIESLQCFNASHGSVTINVTNGSPAYSYSWYSNDDSNVISNLNSYGYSISVSLDSSAFILGALEDSSCNWFIYDDNCMIGEEHNWTENISSSKNVSIKKEEVNFSIEVSDNHSLTLSHDTTLNHSNLPDLPIDSTEFALNNKEDQIFWFKS